MVELIPLAVESVRIAFRTGVTATEIRDELEQQTSPSETWAMTVPTEVGNELELIHKETVRIDLLLCTDLELTTSNRPPWGARRHMSVPHFAKQ